MLWVKKRYAPPDNLATTDIMTRAEKLLMQFPRDFMMVEEEHKGLDSTIWVRLPIPELKRLFPDFVEGRIEDLKARPIKLAVEESEFESAFRSLPPSR